MIKESPLIITEMPINNNNSTDMIIPNYLSSTKYQNEGSLNCNVTCLWVQDK